jgi:flagellar biosynthesis GTPase FlhF
VIVKEFAKWFLKDLKLSNDPSKLDPSKLTPEFIDTLNVNDKFDDFLYANEDLINQKFNDENDFQTSIRGLKVRGVYESKREAEVRAKVLQKRDPNFHVYVGQVGYWLPWDPNPDNIAEQEYANDQLNTLMKKYQENRRYKDDLYAQETEERKKAAKEENQRRKYYQQKTDEEEREAEQKIKELRDIVDRKDHLYKKVNDGESPAMGVGPEASEGDGVAHPAGVSGDKVEAGGLMAGMDDGKHADPWMQRREAAAQGRNYETGSAKFQPSVEERNKILGNIVNSIF